MTINLPNLFKYEIYFNDNLIGTAASFNKWSLERSMVAYGMWSYGMKIKNVGFNFPKPLDKTPKV